MRHRNPRASKTAPAHDEMRDQEVLRANKELAAYFRGHRTEREARGALKIIKAFLRQRERIDPAQRRPLPGVRADEPPAKPRETKKATVRRRTRRRVVPATPASPVEPVVSPVDDE